MLYMKNVVLAFERNYNFTTSNSIIISISTTEILCSNSSDKITVNDAECEFGYQFSSQVVIYFVCYVCICVVCVCVCVCMLVCMYVCMYVIPEHSQRCEKQFLAFYICIAIINIIVICETNGLLQKKKINNLYYLENWGNHESCICIADSI